MVEARMSQRHFHSIKLKVRAFRLYFESNIRINGWFTDLFAIFIFKRHEKIYLLIQARVLNTELKLIFIEVLQKKIINLSKFVKLKFSMKLEKRSKF